MKEYTDKELNYRTVEDITSKHVITRSYRDNLDILDELQLNSWDKYERT